MVLCVSLQARDNSRYVNLFMGTAGDHGQVSPAAQLPQEPVPTVRTEHSQIALLTDDTMVHRYGGNAEYPEPFVGRAFRNRTDGYAPEMDEDDGTSPSPRLHHLPFPADRRQKNCVAAMIFGTHFGTSCVYRTETLKNAMTKGR